MSICVLINLKKHYEVKEITDSNFESANPIFFSNDTVIVSGNSDRKSFTIIVLASDI